MASTDKRITFVIMQSVPVGSGVCRAACLQ
nr:MAG TPA: hypothetical protein [Caudoviricetes sp.]